MKSPPCRAEKPMGGTSPDTTASATCALPMEGSAEERGLASGAPTVVVVMDLMEPVGRRREKGQSRTKPLFPVRP